MYVALLVLSVVIYAVVWLQYLRHPACSWFHPLTIYLAFHGLVFVLRPILSWYYDYTFIYHLYLFLPDDYAKQMTLIVTNLGLVSFSIASLHFGRSRLVFKVDRTSLGVLDEMRRPLWLITLPLLLLIAYSISQIWNLRATGADMVTGDLSTGTFINTSGNGYAQFAYEAAVTLLPMLAWVGRFRIWWLGALALTILFLSVSGIRGPIISLIVSTVTIYLYMRRQRVPGWQILTVGVVAVLGFNAIGADRGQAVRDLLSGETITQSGPSVRLAPLEGMDTGSLEFIEYLVDKIPRNTRTYEYFIDNLQIFTEPIPRVLWRNKPIGQPIRFFSLFDYGYPIGMTRSLPGEGWAQLGLIGVALWCGLAGGVCGAIYNRFTQGQQTPVQVASYAAFLATLIVFYRDGVLISLLRQGIFFMIPPVLWWLTARMMGVANASDLRIMAEAQRKRAARRAMASSDPAEIDSETDGPESPRDYSRLPRSRRHPRRSVLPRI